MNLRSATTSAFASKHGGALSSKFHYKCFSWCPHKSGRTTVPLESNPRCTSYVSNKAWNRNVPSRTKRRLATEEHVGTKRWPLGRSFFRTNPTDWQSKNGLTLFDLVLHGVHSIVHWRSVWNLGLNHPCASPGSSTIKITYIVVMLHKWCVWCWCCAHILQTCWTIRGLMNIQLQLTECMSQPTPFPRPKHNSSDSSFFRLAWHTKIEWTLAYKT